VRQFSFKNKRAVSVCLGAAAVCGFIWPFIGLAIVIPALVRHRYSCSAPAVGFALAVALIGILRGATDLCLAPEEGEEEGKDGRQVRAVRQRVVTAPRPSSSPPALEAAQTAAPA
jgi:hypothetical protein